MSPFVAYHVVTERPMYVGQHILFDADHHNGVYHRVQEKLPLVDEIHSNPERFRGAKLEHHLAVALRELALEEVRLQRYPHYPSRMACLYVSKDPRDCEMWARLFMDWKRPTLQIVKLRVNGPVFIGDAINCFDGSVCHDENLANALRYWENAPNSEQKPPIREVLAGGDIEVVQILRTF